MKKAILTATFLLISCSGENFSTITYNLAAPVKVDVISQSTFATMEGEYEHIGTRTETYFENEYSQNGDTLYLNRTFISDASKGYLKKSYPGDLALRTPNLKLSAKGLEVIGIKGYENFDSAVVAKIPSPGWQKKQIIQMTSQANLDNTERRRWQITHLLLGNVPLNSNVTALLTSQGRLPVPFVRIDSVLTKEVKKINDKKCIEYEVHLQEEEPFPYFIWEQHIQTVKSGEPFKNYLPKEAVYQNRYEVALNLENGIPCLEREIKFGIHGMQDPETGDSVTFKSQVSHERYYTEVF